MALPGGASAYRAWKRAHIDTVGRVRRSRPPGFFTAPSPHPRFSTSAALLAYRRNSPLNPAVNHPPRVPSRQTAFYSSVNASKAGSNAPSDLVRVQRGESGLVRFLPSGWPADAAVQVPLRLVAVVPDRPTGAHKSPVFQPGHDIQQALRQNAHSYLPAR